MKKPLKLIPVAKDYIWGGTKLKTHFNKQADSSIVAETWELSVFDGAESLLQQGACDCNNLAELREKHPDWFGVAGSGYFPVLVKLIDATNDLSVQVHPTDDDALTVENSLGKTEMWYIVDAEDDGAIYLGFSKDVTLQQVEQAISENKLTCLLNKIPVKKGDCYLVPAGTVHAILHGVTVVEVQQNSNITYRLYDYGRVDANGVPRQLHVEKALNVIHLQAFKDATCTKQIDANRKLLATCKYFTATQIMVDGTVDLHNDNSFVAITVFEGNGCFADGTQISKGDTWFIPCGYSATITGKLSLIETTVDTEQ